MKKIGVWVANKRILILIVAVLLAIPAGYGALNTELNYDILTYLPKDAESVKGSKIMDESFGSSDSGILIFKDLEDYVIQDIESEIERLDGVAGVVWARDLVNITVPVEMLPDEVVKTFYRDDATLLMINFNNSAANEITQEAIVSIREIIEEQEGYLTGASAIIRDIRDLSNKEKDMYIALAILLAVIILSLTLPSTLIPFIFLIGIGFGVLYNLGSNFFLPDVSYVTSAIAGVLQLGVTMDFSIFLYHRYEEERGNYEDHKQAMAVAIHKTAISISGAALTTMAGFLALVAMELTLGANIGIVMAKGVFLGVLCTLTIMPSLLLVFDKTIHRFKHGTILPSFKKISRFVVNKHIVLMVLSFLLLIPAIYGSTHKEVYYKLDTSLPRDMASIVSLEVMKESFDMKSTYSLAVNSQITDMEMKKMINELKNVEGVNQVIAYQQFIGPMVPKEMVAKELLHTFINEEFSKLTILSKYSAATDEGNKQTEAMNVIVKSYDVNGVLTGEIPMTKDLIEVTDRDIKVVNILSVVLLLIIIGITFKSLTLPILLVMSIELAVLINMAVPFYMGTKIPFIASIVIGSIQLGTTVDYAILLTNRFKEQMYVESDKFEAMAVSIQYCSKSIVTSGLTFFGSTFAVAVVSDIDMIGSLSMMMGRGALISMVVIMVLLPALLLIFENIISKTTVGWKKKESNKKMKGALKPIFNIK